MTAQTIDSVLYTRFHVMTVKQHMLVKLVDLLISDVVNIEVQLTSMITETTSPCIIPRLVIPLIGIQENAFLFVLQKTTVNP